MQVMPTGIIFYGVCKVQTPKCIAQDVAPITAVLVPPGRTQVNICKPCLDELIRQGLWVVEGVRVRDMRHPVDIAVYSPNGEIQLIVEVKNRRNISSSWLKKIYLEATNNSIVSNVPYFLLALQDQFCLWKRSESFVESIEPHFVMNPQKFIEPYVAAQSLRINNAEDEFRNEPYLVIEKHYHFQMVVKEWLSDIITCKGELPDELYHFWVSSGLYEKIRNGSVEVEAIIDKGNELKRFSDKMPNMDFGAKRTAIITP